jgi:hypothetical protein
LGPEALRAFRAFDAMVTPVLDLPPSDRNDTCRICLGIDSPSRPTGAVYRRGRTPTAGRDGVLPNRPPLARTRLVHGPLVERRPAEPVGRGIGPTTLASHGLSHESLDEHGDRGLNHVRRQRRFPDRAGRDGPGWTLEPRLVNSRSGYRFSSRAPAQNCDAGSRSCAVATISSRSRRARASEQAARVQPR